MNRAFQKFSQHWDAFWFRSNQPYQWALFRSVLAGILLFFYVIRSLDLKFLFSQDGILPVERLPDFISMKSRFSILVQWPSDGVLYATNAVLLLSLLCLFLGFFPRISATVVYVCHISFIFRNPIAVYGADLISSFFLLYLIFADYKPMTQQEKTNPRLSQVLSSTALRMGQLQLCIIYAYSGLEKMRGTHWWRGEAIWDVTANFQLARFDFSFVSHFPALITAVTLGTLLWEIYFPALIWIRPLRYPMLVFGVLLHFGIGLTMNITFFAIAMVSVYILFLDVGAAKRVAKLTKLSLLIEKK